VLERELPRDARAPPWINENGGLSSGSYAGLDKYEPCEATEFAGAEIERREVALRLHTMLSCHADTHGANPVRHAAPECSRTHHRPVNDGEALILRRVCLGQFEGAERGYD
jgi:hypothetical protein